MTAPETPRRQNRPTDWVDALRALVGLVVMIGGIFSRAQIALSQSDYSDLGCDLTGSPTVIALGLTLMGVIAAVAILGAARPDVVRVPFWMLMLTMWLDGVVLAAVWLAFASASLSCEL